MDDYEVCLEQRYGDRIHELATVGRLPGTSLSLNRLDFICVTPDAGPDATDGSLNGMSFRHIALPLIDDASTAAERQWNQTTAHKDMSQGCDGRSDYTLSYEVGLATPVFISVSWTASYYPHGAAHPSWQAWNENREVLTSLRPLQAEDLFDKTKPWFQVLTDLLKTGVEDHFGFQTLPDDNYFRRVASDPRRWFLLAEGLQVHFQPYELDSYAFSPTVTVPWETLRPLLKPFGPMADTVSKLARGS